MHDIMVRSGPRGGVGIGAWGGSSSEVSTGRKGLLHVGGRVIPESSSEQSQLQGSPFLCSEFNVSSDPRERQTTRHHSAVYFPELNPVQCDSRKSGNGCSLFSLISLSTKNASFKNSIFLMMPPMSYSAVITVGSRPPARPPRATPSHAVYHTVES